MTLPSDRSVPTAFDPARPVFITGGRGFVGSHLVRLLIAEGVRPHLFGPEMDVDLLADLAGQFDETHGSVEDLRTMTRSIRDSGAGAVVSMAAYGGGKGLMSAGDSESARAMAINVEGFRNTLEAAHLSEVDKVVWADSTVVYGPAELYPKDRVDESDARRPVTVYGLTKVMAEDIAQYYRDRFGMAVTGLRMSLLLGPGLWYQGAASAIAGMLSNAAPGHVHEVSFHDEQIDLMHVEDLVRAMLSVLRANAPLEAAYNVNGFTASLGQIAAQVQERVPGYRVDHRIAPPTVKFPLVSDQRFRRDTGFTPAHSLASVIDELTGEGALA